MVLLFLLILTIVSTVFTDPLEGYSYRISNVKCSGSSKNTTTKHFCFAKNYNRNVSTLNFGFTLTRDLNKLFLKYSVDFKYGAVFHPVLDPPVLEWCSFFDGNSNNVLLSVIMDMVRDSSPQLVHKCPYKVTMLKF